MATEGSDQPPRSHLFISYAGEDHTLANWLALRLTAEGYAVWMDSLRLLGGESYPRDIDRAIKARTFRLLAILSQHSVDKPNPRKERTLALNIARERNEDFLIPLNADGLSPTDLDWMTSDLTFILFHKSWKAGLRRLLTKLASIDAPKVLHNGRSIAASAFLPEGILRDEPDPVYSNLFRFTALPNTLLRFRLSRQLSRSEKPDLASRWAHYLAEPTSLTSPTYAFAFEHPPSALPPDLSVSSKPDRIEWRDADSAFGFVTWHLVKPLLRKSLMLHSLRKGLRLTEDGAFLYFPSGLARNDVIKFRSYTGSSRLRVVGKRTFRSEHEFRYHLGFTFDVLRLEDDDIVAKFRIRLRLTALNGKPLSYIDALSRRKSITRTWYNHQFLIRHLAVVSFLAGEGPEVCTGDEQPIAISSLPVSGSVPRAIDESALPKGRQPYRKKTDETVANG